MKALISATFLLTFGTFLIAQVQTAPSAARHSYSSELGFSYDLPSDWEVVNPQGDLPQAKAKASEGASTEQEKRGLACAQMGMTARSGGSVIVDVALPFDCFGQQMSEKDLVNFGEDASQGLKQSFDISDPVYGTYVIGAHNLWIERVKGSPKGQAGASYTIEITCAVLKKAAVCWMAMAADDAALQSFERAKVSLDGDAPLALVPPTAFNKKPS